MALMAATVGMGLEREFLEGVAGERMRREGARAETLEAAGQVRGCGQ